METERVFVNVVKSISDGGYEAGKTLPDRPYL